MKKLKGSCETITKELALIPSGRAKNYLSKEWLKSSKIFEVKLNIQQVDCHPNTRVSNPYRTHPYQTALFQKQNKIQLESREKCETHREISTKCKWYIQQKYTLRDMMGGRYFLGKEQLKKNCNKKSYPSNTT